MTHIEVLKRIRSILSVVRGLYDDDDEYIGDARKAVDQLIDMLDSQPQQEPVAGIVLVPYEPCFEMQEQGSMASNYDLSLSRAKRVYQAMIDMHQVLEKKEPYTSPPKPQQEPVQQDIWILTSERNAYDQYGEYFEAVFIGKPTEKQIRNACDLHGEYAKAEVEHILSGGGRIKHEDKWYNLQKEEAAHGIKGDA